MMPVIRPFKKRVIDQNSAKDMAEKFKVLSDPTRIRLLAALAEAELCVSELTEILQMEQSAVSHQLSHLRSLQLVKNRKIGRQVYYTLNDHHIRDLLSSSLAQAQEG